MLDVFNYIVGGVILAHYLYNGARVHAVNGQMTRYTCSALITLGVNSALLIYAPRLFALLAFIGAAANVAMCVKHNLSYKDISDAVVENFH
ncbi:MAG: hypothetical protein VXZ72_02285 [Chlamydiota bacterium]|nr:hypothetical protein [Chlamydiota bacterium]